MSASVRTLRTTPTLTRFHDHTVLFRVGNLVFVTYGLFAGAAFAVALATAALAYGATAGDTGELVRLGLWPLLPGVILGARAFSVLLELPKLRQDPVGALLKPGFMLHGGVAGGLGAVLAWGMITGRAVLPVLDALALALPLGEAICRLGCLVYGCCWGRACRVPWAIRYTSPDAKVVRVAPHLRGVPLHPAQLYASAAYLLQFLVFLGLAAGGLPTGVLTALYLVTHPPIRVLLERFRDDDRGRLAGPITHTNLYSLLQLVGGVALVATQIGGPVMTGGSLDDALAALLAPLPLVGLGALFLVVAAVFGLHWRAVGQWLPPKGV